MSASRFLNKQLVYAREISNERLSRRSSVLTSEKTIVEYASTFDKEDLVGTLDDITFIASGDPHYSSFTELEALVETLGPAQAAYVTRSQELIAKSSTPMVVRDGNESSIGTSPQQAMAVDRKRAQKIVGRPSCGVDSDDDNDDDDHGSDRVPPRMSLSQVDGSKVKESSENDEEHSSTEWTAGKSLEWKHNEKRHTRDNLSQPPRSSDPQEYLGFKLMHPDSYTRASNEYLRMNEIAVLRFSAALGLGKEFQR